MYKMTTKAPAGVGGLDIGSWLAELHMECYKKNLENFETIRVSAACVATGGAVSVCSFQE